MKTHDEKTKAHIKAIALAFAEDKHSVVFTGPTHVGSRANLSLLHDDPFAYFIKPKPTIAPGHNPDGLTVEQVPSGERLLDKDEIKTRGQTKYIQFYYTEEKCWSGRANGDCDYRTYKTKLSREQLALLDKNEGWIPWFGGECPVDKELKVDLYLVDGPGAQNNKAKWIRWTLYGNRHDIIAYRPAKTEPKVIPWDCAADVPGPVCWLRAGTGIGGLVIGIMKEGIIGASYPANLLHTWEAIGNAHTEYSTDRINWFPCNKKEETK